MNNSDDALFQGMYKDAFMEIGNIGAGHSANALSKMLNRRIDISLPRVNFIKIAGNLNEELPFDEKDNLGVVTTKTSGDLEFDLYAVFTEGGVKKFLNLLTYSKTENIEKLTAFEKSTLKEIGNILLLHYASSINNFISQKLRIYPDVPEIAIGESSNIVDKLYKEKMSGKDEIVSIDVDVYTDEGIIDVYMFMLPTEETLQNIVSVFF
ncbi:MAG: chemotaxis protein CheC [Candidatus Hodarchaeales archaeon]|jgi:chemotaxis protein CheC